MNAEDITFQPASTLKKLQEEKLQQLLLYVSQHSPFYKKLFRDHHIDIAAIKSIEELYLLPTTGKEDLQRHNNDFICVSPEKIIEYTSTSGTLGSPVTIALTENDLERLADNEYHSFLTTGGQPSDVYQLMLTLDRQFMAGIAYYSGIRKMGGSIIRMGPGVPSLQWETILHLKPTAIVAVPSFILKLIQFANEHYIDVNSTSVKRAICIGENIRNQDFTLNILGKRITGSWNIQLYSTYASTEMQTAFTECREGHGGHNRPELLITELLDENNRPVSANVAGEVTITTLGVEGMPLVRYKTGDICMYLDEPCGCGRNSIRLSPILGRKNQLIKFKGTTLYPSAIFDILNEMKEIHDYIVEVQNNEVGLDEVILYLAVAGDSIENDHKIRAYLQARLRVSPFIKYLSAEEIKKMQSPDLSRKAIKFIDKRQ
jgi:phenylacetate-CoA ligase